jgi:hypothetical protein
MAAKYQESKQEILIDEFSVTLPKKISNKPSRSKERKSHSKYIN